jgi:hypothetical protein
VSSKDSAEAAAFHYVPAILGVQLEPWDNCGRQGAVDALLHYSDGRIAALEVTSIAAEGRRQLYSLLNANQVLPNPGRWSWSASIDDPRDFPEFQRRAGDIVTKSEALGITHPEHAYHEAFQGDPDFDWIVRSSVTMWGHRPSRRSAKKMGRSDPSG